MPAFRSLGDMSTAFLLSRHTGMLKSQIQQNSTELTTGRTSDLSKTTRGDFRTIAAIEHSLTTLKTNKLAINEAQGFFSAAQAGLDVVQNRAEAASGTLLSVPHAPTEQTLNRAARDVRDIFETTVGALNQRSSDRAIFSGDASDSTALASVDTMIADIETAISGLTTAADVETAINDWFDTPGIGFDLIGYTGSDSDLAPFRLGNGETADFPVTAADPALRELMKGMAMGTILSSSAFSGSTNEKVKLARSASEKIMTASGGIVDLQATIGNSEAAAQSALVRNGAEATSLELARSEAVGIDPYDAAAKLQTAQTQLETLFALTARISRLSLVDYIR